MPSVDVVIPCYNYGRFLPEAVISVRSQGVSDLRILIIDNASTDDSVEVARRLAALHPEVQVSAHAVNQGALASYNEGVDWAKADYFLLVDADDMLAPGALRRALSVMEANPKVVMTYGPESLSVDGGVSPPIGEDHFDAPGDWKITTGRALIERLCRTPINIIGADTVIRRTWAQKRVGHYRETLPHTCDLEMWLRLASLGDVAATPRIQAIRRIHPAQISERLRTSFTVDFRQREEAFASFFEHEGSSMPDREELMGLVRKGLGKHAYWSAVSHFLRGRSDVAVELMAISRERRGGTGLLPPIDWLFRMQNPLGRMREIMRDAALGR